MTPYRPARLALVAGTGTEVGKTWVAAAVVSRLRREGALATARKPTQSFAPRDRTDAEILADAAGESAHDVCPAHRWYEVPMAPPMAAAALGRPPFTTADLINELRWPPEIEVGLVESAGGLRSPLAEDGDTVDLAGALRPDVVVLVAHATLGTLNLVRLCADALTGFAVTVHLNRFDAEEDLHVRNRAWIEDRFHVPTTASIDELCRAVTT